MDKKIGHYLNQRHTNSYTDIDFHDFIDMIQSGLGDEEIAKELGINGSHVKKLRNEMCMRY
ncbi:MAG: hypothetical protein AB2421_01130 [Thermotaleaceae bacterium]